MVCKISYIGGNWSSAGWGGGGGGGGQQQFLFSFIKN
jgi:hypothetical protein